MCFPSRKLHLCVICLLIYSVSPGSGHSLHTQDRHDHQQEKHNQTIPVKDQLDESDRNESLLLKEKTDSHEYSGVTVDYFLDELMRKYGNGISMSYEGFEHLLQKLNLANIVFLDHSLECHRANNSSDFIPLHSNHNHSEEAKVSSDSPCPTGHHEHPDHDGHDHDSHEHNDGHGHFHVHKDSQGHIHDEKEDLSSHQHHEQQTNNSINKENGQKDGKPDHEHSDHELNRQDKNSDESSKIDHEHVHDEDHIKPDHDHGDNSDDHEGHSDHDHGDHSDHDHGDQSDHDHGDHSDHDHEDNSGHDHEDHSDHDHGDHSGHNHKDHSNPEVNDHSDHDHKNEHGDNKNVSNSNVHDHSKDHASHEDDPESKKEVVRKKRTDSVSEDECLPPKMMLSLVNTDSTQGLTKDMFVSLCPSLIYQIDADLCHSHRHNHDHSDNDHLHHDHSDHDHEPHGVSKSTESGISAKVWGFSTVAVVIISLVGLFGVAVIPIVQKVFYNHLLQFLVALAVGALSGDALLHLLPHAMAGGHAGEAGGGEGHNHGSHGDGSHKHDLEPIYKGLCGLLGIYFFFLTERILTIFTDMKRRKKKKKNHKRYSNEDENLEKVGEKLANSDMECDEMMLSIHPNKALKGYADETHNEHCTISLSNTTAISHQHGHRHQHEDKVYAEEDVTIISHTSNGHGHGHSHCKDGVPKSISAIAWMVILGDGIHNFSDGLAIGAAFANSITGGFSTSVAVFCHELPHEIGDFAMLLRAGMSPKQAIIYNCVSSILCFFGMVIGVAIGNIQNASLWIFAVVAGMFLYIALVDMLPEMSSVDTKKGEHPFFHLFLQLLGMMIGAGIMLLIALYEEDLRTIFE